MARLLRALRRRDARRRGSKESTYRQLAAKTGWSHAVVGDYLSGKILPSTDRFDVLVQVLGAAPDEQRLLATARDRVEEAERRPVEGEAIRLRFGGTPTVGRDSELAILRTAVQAASHGIGGALFLVGDPGIGKTRLAAEVARMATGADMPILRGRAATPAVQFRPLSEALLSLLRRSTPDSPDLAPYRPALARLVPEWRSERPLDAEDESLVVLAEAVLRLLIVLGRPRGCVLVLEDLHEADHDTLAVIDYLVDNVGPESLLVLGTVRTGRSGALELARAAGRRRTAGVMELSKLDDEAVRQLAAARLSVSANQLPEPVIERLLRAADGVPLHIEELLAGLVDDEVLVRDGGRWIVHKPMPSTAPTTLVETLTGRTKRLGRYTQAVLYAAALLGWRFPASVAGAAVGVTGAELVACLREAVEAQLVVPRQDAETYDFRHVLTAEALRDGLLPLERSELSRQVATAIEASTWASRADRERLAGELWQAGGESRRAAELFNSAGRGAAAQGAVSTGISLLERALSLVDTDALDGLAIEIAEALVGAYADAGRITDAYALGRRFDGRAPGPQRAVLHLRLADAAATAGHWDAGQRELARVHRLLGRRLDATMSARVDAVAARLRFGNLTADRRRAAQRLARRALEAAEVSGQPDVACTALRTLARCARLRDLAEADALCERGLAIAQANNLIGQRIGLLYHLGANEGIRSAETRRLQEALAVASEAGAVAAAHDIELELAVVQVCRAEYEAAEAVTTRCEHTARRLRLTHTALVARGERIIVAAHQGRKAEVDALLAEFRDLGGEDDDFGYAVRGFGLAWCHLLWEDRDGALTELSRAVHHESMRPTSYLSLVHGLHLFLSVLAGAAGRAECARLARSAHAQAGWNRQFLALAQAVLHGRARQSGRAEQAVSAFHELSARYPAAHHLGLRLLAEAALRDGWGDPVQWLRSAAAYFHSPAPAVARGCRVLLRQAGMSVPQHRRGTDSMPGRALELGVTVREYEVLILIGQRLGNQEIGRRLFLSKRTVEKHVASLMTKTGLADRQALADLATSIS